MTAERSRQTAAWFAAHPRAQSRGGGRQPLAASDPFCVLPRPADLAGAETGCRPDPASARSSPGGAGAGQRCFWAGTALRRALNFPRPYQQPGFVPLVQKERQGCSFPSRHALSAGVIAAVWLYFSPPPGRADGRSPGHLRASGADRRTFCPGCNCRCYPWFCIGSGRYVAAVRPFAKKIKEFCILSLTEPVGYGIILLAACASHRSRP